MQAAFSYINPIYLRLQHILAMVDSTIWQQAILWKIDDNEKILVKFAISGNNSEGIRLVTEWPRGVLFLTLLTENFRLRSISLSDISNKLTLGTLIDI